MYNLLAIRSAARRDAQAGFSVAELLIVLAVMAILIAISIPMLSSYRKLYRSDDQSKRIMDMMSEAGQTALVKRKTIRFEIDLTDNVMLLIEDKGPTSPGVLIKKQPLDKTSDLRVDTIPAGVTKPNPPNYNDAVFASDSVGHTDGANTINAHKVWYARFQSDGSVINYSGAPVSANLYIWPPQTSGSLTPRNKGEVRVITMFGGSGAIRYWKFAGTVFVAT